MADLDWDADRSIFCTVDAVGLDARKKYGFITKLTPLVWSNIAF